MKTFQDFST